MDSTTLSPLPDRPTVTGAPTYPKAAVMVITLPMAILRPPFAPFAGTEPPGNTTVRPPAMDAKVFSGGPYGKAKDTPVATRAIVSLTRIKEISVATVDSTSAFERE